MTQSNENLLPATQQTQPRIDVPLEQDEKRSSSGSAGRLAHNSARLLTGTQD